MNWSSFIQSLETFFSDIGQQFLVNIKAAIPVAEQAAVNFLEVIAEAVITGIENGTIPLPTLVSEDVADSQALGKQKREVAFNTIKEKLGTLSVPQGVVIKDSIIYFEIEVAVQKHKNGSIGNGGNFIGGNSDGK